MTEGRSVRTKKVEFPRLQATAPLKFKSAPPVTKRQPSVVPVIYPREMHSISRQNIDSDALKIMRRLIQAGYKAHLVGGGVRDLLLDKKPKDFDIATDATPREIKNLFGNCRIIGKRFKLAHIYFNANKIIEVSTFRDMHEAIVVEDALEHDRMIITQDNNYGNEMTDALRRDLTINGLFYDLSTFSIIDYVGGMKDLDNQIVRVIGDPATRFAEDPARMIRVLRHAARSGFVIEPECLVALEEHNSLINKCAPARIFDEFKKDLFSGFAENIISLMQRHGILQHILPDISALPLWFKNKPNPLQQSLSRLDTQAKKGDDQAGFAFLCCVTLLGAILSERLHEQEELDAALRSLASLCANREALDPLTAHNFRSLAVPRKEKDRICTTLKAWADCEHALASGRRKIITNRFLIEDLRSFLGVVPDGLVSEACFNAIQSSKGGTLSIGTNDGQGRRAKTSKKSELHLASQSSSGYILDEGQTGAEDSMVDDTGGADTTDAPKKRRRRSRGGRRKNQANAANTPTE
jgi:poly(A) polymerase